MKLGFSFIFQKLGISNMDISKWTIYRQLKIAYFNNFPCSKTSSEWAHILPDCIILTKPLKTTALSDTLKNSTWADCNKFKIKTT